MQSIKTIFYLLATQDVCCKTGSLSQVIDLIDEIEPELIDISQVEDMQRGQLRCKHVFILKFLR